MVIYKGSRCHSRSQTCMNHLHSNQPTTKCFLKAFALLQGVLVRMLSGRHDGGICLVWHRRKGDVLSICALPAAGRQETEPSVLADLLMQQFVSVTSSQHYISTVRLSKEWWEYSALDFSCRTKEPCDHIFFWELEAAFPLVCGTSLGLGKVRKFMLRNLSAVLKHTIL